MTNPCEGEDLAAIRPIYGALTASYIAEHQEMYPKAMREGPEVFEKLLANKLSWGAFDGEILIGWTLFEKRNPRFKPREAYCYDLAVLPTYQGKGIAKMLWRHACKELRWLDYWIHAHCRRQSYELISKPIAGYQLYRDLFIPNHYAIEYEDESLKGEHAHEVWLQPVGQV